MRSLPNSHLNLCNDRLPCQAPSFFGFRGAFKKKFKGLAEVVFCLLNRVALTGNIQFGAKGDKGVTVLSNDCC